MSDFFQNGAITTLHRLGSQTIEKLESELDEYAAVHPTALVIPSLMSELEGPALGSIVQQLSGVSYLHEIIIALGRADRDGFEEAQRFFAPLGDRARILWIEGPRVDGLVRELGENRLDLGEPGKGRASWLAMGYVLAGEHCHSIALHDADILTYDRLMLGRLCYPLMNPTLNFEYTKGYYARVTDRLHGRVTRLFLTPLVRALMHMVGVTPFLRYLDSFRYALAGEFAISTNLARSVRIPGDWGLEVGLLAEVYRNTSLQRISQVDIAETYEHKHQSLSAKDPSEGLNRMASDITQTVLRTVATEGTEFGGGFASTLKIVYMRHAQDAVRSYYEDSVLNGLSFDRHAETLAVEVFVEALARACEEFQQNPMATASLPNWNRISAAIPSFPERFRAAVDADNR